MTVAELIRRLQRCSPDAQVRFSVDYDEFVDINEVVEVKYMGSSEEEDSPSVELR